MGKESVVVEREGKTAYDWSGVDTVGNHSYIPCRRYEWPKEVIRHFILELLKAFEEAHPELEVTHWRDVHEVICNEATNHCADPYLCGLWVDHRPARVTALEQQ